MRHYCGSFTYGKGWRKTIGCRLATDGRFLPCRFWLGMDQQKASIAALQIEAFWMQQGAKYWTADAFAVADALRLRLTRAVGSSSATAPSYETCAPIIVERPQQRQQQPLTVLQGIERYRKSVLDSSVSDATKHSVISRTKSLERSPIAAMPLRDIGAEQLSATVGYWLARPIAAKTGAPISPTSAALIVKTARATFDYLDSIGAWTAPRRFDRIFRLPKTNSAPKITTLDIEELQRLYAHADSRMRLIILLGLNCGFCSMEIATMKRGEIWMDTIRRSRQKTAVEQHWGLWDETVKLIAENIAPSNDRDLALLTDGSSPLVYYSDKRHRIDTVGNCWQRLAKRSKVSKPFKLLRKTGATMIRAIGGVEVSEQYLAHSEKSMAKFYSRPDPQRLADALIELRQRLTPMFKVGG